LLVLAGADHDAIARWIDVSRERAMTPRAQDLGLHSLPASAAPAACACGLAALVRDDSAACEPVHIRPPGGCQGAHLREIYAEQLDDLLTQCFARQQEHVHPGCQVGIQLYLSIQYALVSTDYHPAVVTNYG
jgi:hypothetical protein